MLGTYGTSAFKDIADFTNHRDYLNFMYGNLEGFIARCVITPTDDTNDKDFKQTLWKSDRLINNNRYYGVSDVYTSMNSFFKPNRKVENLKHLNALYVDIDCYKLGLTQEQVLGQLESDYFGMSLPVPSFVMNSGRGLYLIWKIDEDRNALPRWKSVQQYLYETCLPFNADPQCLDASRILRVPYSINSKSDTPVCIMSYFNVNYTLYEIIKEYDINTSGFGSDDQMQSDQIIYPFGVATEKQRRYAAVIAEREGIELPDFSSFNETCDFIKKYSANNIGYPYGEATQKQRLYAAGIAEKKGLELPDFSRFDITFSFINQHADFTHGEETEDNIIPFATVSTKTLLEGRCEDLCRLFSLRKGSDCHREYGLFVYRLWQCELSHDYDYALKQTLLLNSKMDVPLDEKYVITRTASAEKKVQKGGTYKYSNKKLIEVLGITKDEMDQLSYINDYSCVNKEHKAIRNRVDYLNRLNREGKLEKKESINIRRQTIANMRSENKSKSDICALLDISTRTYERDLIVITANNIAAVASNVIETVKDSVSNMVHTNANKIKETTGEVINWAVENANNGIGQTILNISTSVTEAVKTIGKKPVDSTIGGSASA